MYLEEPFERTIEVRDKMTLGRLHDAIQQLTGFDNDHLFTFFIARTLRGKREFVVDAGDGEEEQEMFYKTPLHDVYPLPRDMRLFYWFDFGDDWMFQIRRPRQPKKAEKGVKYPRVIAEVGPRPEQYPYCE
jgi:hypothetical protein